MTIHDSQYGISRYLDASLGSSINKRDAMEWRDVDVERRCRNTGLCVMLH
jgi:hypothetical protein